MKFKEQICSKCRQIRQIEIPRRRCQQCRDEKGEKVMASWSNVLEKF